MGFGRRGYYRATLRMVLQQEWERESGKWTRQLLRYQRAMAARLL